MYTGFKIMAVLSTALSTSHSQHHIAALGTFFSAYFWKDFTFLSLNTQQDFRTFVASLRSAAAHDQRFSTAYCELLLFSDDGLLGDDTVTQLEEAQDTLCKDKTRFVGSLKVTVSVMIFNTYLYEIFLLTESLLKMLPIAEPTGESMVDQPQLSSKIEAKVQQLEQKLGKTTRFVKYILSLLELTACDKQRRKEAVLRVHFDFFYLAYLSLLYGLEDRTSGTVLAELFRTHCLQVLTFLLVLIETTDSKEKNFTTVIKMKRLRSTVQCDSLAYKMAMGLMLVNDKPIWELEGFDYNKVDGGDPRNLSSLHTGKATLSRTLKSAFSVDASKSIWQDCFL